MGVHLAGDDHPVLDENRSVIAEAPHVLVENRAAAAAAAAVCLVLGTPYTKHKAPSTQQAQQQQQQQQQRGSRRERGAPSTQRARMWRMLPPKFRILQPAVAAQQRIQTNVTRRFRREPLCRRGGGPKSYFFIVLGENAILLARLFRVCDVDMVRWTRSLVFLHDFDGPRAT